MKWGPQQAAALTEAGRWLDQCGSELRRGQPLSKQVLRLFGYAGTGKTTLAKKLSSTAIGMTQFGAFTGKAAQVLASKGCEGARTIHSMIYDVKERRDGTRRFVLSKNSDAAFAGLIIIDEVSMVNEELGNDLLSFGRPVLVLGDPAQLPPTSGAGFFTDAQPDVMLTEIHRQAEDNPIIHLATLAREKRDIAFGSYGESMVVTRGTLSGADVLTYDQLICGRNETRTAFNRQLRARMGCDGAMPEDGDRLVCLYNDPMKGIMNGGLFTVAEVLHRKSDPQHIMLDIKAEGGNEDAIEVKVRREFFTGGAAEIPRGELRGTQQFDYGYALTCHKAQGSQWRNLVVYDEAAVFKENAWRWRYTAITRASEKLTLVI